MIMMSALTLLAQAPQPAQPNMLVNLLPFAFIAVIFYFMLIRPQNKKQKEHQKLIESIKTGDQVVTSAGIHGTVTNVKEKTVLVRVADNVKIEFDRGAIAFVEKEPESKVVPS